VQRGAYVWETGTKYQTKLAPCSLREGASPAIPAPSYLVPSDDAWNGFSVLHIVPSSSTDTNVIVRCRSAFGVSYTPSTQLVQPVADPVFLQPDEGADMRLAFSRTTHFSENDWHENFVKVASAIGRVGAALMDGLEYVGRKSSAVARAMPAIGQLATSVALA
jgi:hypothetical protein